MTQPVASQASSSVSMPSSPLLPHPQACCVMDIDVIARTCHLVRYVPCCM